MGPLCTGAGAVCAAPGRSAENGKCVPTPGRHDPGSRFLPAPAAAACEKFPSLVLVEIWQPYERCCDPARPPERAITYSHLFHRNPSDDAGCIALTERRASDRPGYRVSGEEQ